MGFWSDFENGFVSGITFIPNQIYDKILTPVGNKIGDVVDTVDNGVNNLTRGAGNVLTGVGNGLTGVGNGLGNLAEFLPLMMIGGGVLVVIMLLKN